MRKPGKIILAILSFLIFILAGSVIYIAYPDVHPLGSVSIMVSRGALIQKSANILEPWKINRESFDIGVNSRQKHDLAQVIYYQEGLSEGNDLLRKTIPAFFQEVTWTNHRSISVPDLGIIERVRFNFSGMGQLLSFDLEIPDSVKLDSISIGDARKTAELFLNTYYKNNQGKLIFDQSSTIEQDDRTDYQFVWKGKLSKPVLDFTVKIKISGNRVSSFGLNFQLPSPPVPKEIRTQDIIATVLEVSVYLFFIIFTLIVAFKRIRNYEISFRFSLYVVFLLVISYLPELFLSVGDEPLWQHIIVTILMILFMGIVLFVSWAVGESITREQWNEKFIELDLYTHGYLLNSRQGYAVIRGIFFGTVSFALLSLLLWILQRYIKFTFDLEGYNLSGLASDNPALSLMGSGMRKAIFLFPSVFLLLVPYLYQKKIKTLLCIIVGAIPIAIILYNVITPIYLALPIVVLMLSILIWVLIQYDALTAFASLVVFLSVDSGMVLFYSQALSSTVLIIFLVLLGVYALTAITTRDKQVDIDALSPGLVAYINERKRLKKELDVAREVQQSFLPQSNPVIPGLEITSECIPASEVGGDYYDFIHLNDTCLGIALGDVSGKGTHAAFYMTLAKGFLRALTKSSLSPAHVLNAMNQLFYENTRRNAFISMIYTVFDVNAGKVILARSGHDPVIHYSTRDKKSYLVQAKGIALGLDRGDIFNKIIEEVEIPLIKDDIFILYTDGFTEAMNKNHEEYGTERLLTLITHHAGSSAAELRNLIFKDVTQFRGKAIQHDDMTIVIVKVK